MVSSLNIPPLQLFGELCVSELAKREDEHVLSGEAGIRQSRFSALAPFRKSHVVELAQILGDDKRRDAVFKALLEEDQSPHPSIPILERMNLLKLNMKVENRLERLLGRFIPREQLKNFPLHLARGTRLHFTDHIIEPLKEAAFAAAGVSASRLLREFARPFPED